MLSREPRVPAALLVGCKLQNKQRLETKVKTGPQICLVKKNGEGSAVKKTLPHFKKKKVAW